MKFLIILICIIFPSLALPQNLSKNIITILDSIKIFYGDPCEIGVESSLIKDLYEFASDSSVKSYLNEYELVKNNIETFRQNYLQMIEDDPALLLNLTGIFEGKKINVINAAGIYFGSENVNHLNVSYIIIRNNIEEFYQEIIQFANFDKTFRSEISALKSDWFHSSKLKEISGTPFSEKFQPEHEVLE
jgi:hypothetical protein